MSADAFEKTNLGWQVQQLQQQLGEWIELTFSPTQRKGWDKSPFSWLDNLSLPDWLPKVFFWLAIGLLVAWIAWQLWQAWGYSLSSFRLRQRNSASKPRQEAAIERSLSDWLRLAQDFYRQGNYREACRAIYMAMLQRLNDTGIAPHEPSRTDGEYLQITQQFPPEISYQTLLTVHEQLCFGNAEISSVDFDRCQQAYNEIDSNE